VVLRYEHNTLRTDLESPRNFIVNSWDLVLRFDMINYFEIFKIYFSWFQQ